MKTQWSWIAVGVVANLALLGTVPARAEHFDISLIVRTAKGFAESGWDTAPPEGGLNKRQAITATVGEDIETEWRMRSEFPHGIMKNVTIRMFVAPEKEIGQLELPAADAPRVLDNSFVADYLPKHQAKGLLHFRVLQPGNYLVRIESEWTQREHGHEHFGAVDLKVE